MKKIQDLGEKDVVHCPTLEEAERILKMAHGLGLRWAGGGSFVDENFWGVRKDRTAYALLRGEYCSIEYYQERGYTIHRASEFLQSLPEKWAIKIDSQEVIDVVGAWLDENYCDNDYNFHASWEFDFMSGNYFVCSKLNLHHIESRVPVGYTRISLEQFKEVYPQIKKGDWVYFSDGWETVMQFDGKGRTLGSCGINSYTRYPSGDIEFRENDVTSSPIRLATPEELSRIRDAYRPAEFDDLIKELERNFQEPPEAGWKSPVAALAADQWNEALKLAINLLKDKQKV